jgi:hypothetical protein
MAWARESDTGMRPPSVWRHVTAGIVVGAVLLHPITMLVYFIEFESIIAASGSMTGSFGAVARAFMPSMLAMAAVYGALGGLVGLTLGRHSLRSYRGFRERAVYERLVSRGLRHLIAAGESSELEFKSSLRWDHERASVNRQLEDVVVKTVSGLMNASGGAVLIGVRDDGSVGGIEKDYQTLKRGDRDGFHQHVHHLVASRIGADLCSLIRVRFDVLDGHDVAILYVLPAARPVFVGSGHEREYFLRTGNLTRALNAQEAVMHVESRFGFRYARWSDLASSRDCTSHAPAMVPLLGTGRDDEVAFRHRHVIGCQRSGRRAGYVPACPVIVPVVTGAPYVPEILPVLHRAFEMRADGREGADFSGLGSDQDDRLSAEANDPAAVRGHIGSRARVHRAHGGPNPFRRLQKRKHRVQDGP